MEIYRDILDVIERPTVGLKPTPWCTVYDSKSVLDQKKIRQLLRQIWRQERNWRRKNRHLIGFSRNASGRGSKFSIRDEIRRGIEPSAKTTGARRFIVAEIRFGE